MHLIEYAGNHPWLVTMAIAAAILVIGFELRVRQQDFAAISPQEAIRLMNQGALDGFDRVFIWSGDRRLFLAIIKLLEDMVNARVDCKDFGVRAMERLMGEKPPPMSRRGSSFLPRFSQPM